MPSEGNSVRSAWTVTAATLVALVTVAIHSWIADNNEMENLARGQQGHAEQIGIIHSKVDRLPDTEMLRKIINEMLIRHERAFHDKAGDAGELPWVPPEKPVGG